MDFFLLLLLWFLRGGTEDKQLTGSPQDKERDVFFFFQRLCDFDSLPAPSNVLRIYKKRKEWRCIDALGPFVRCAAFPEKERRPHQCVLFLFPLPRQRQTLGVFFFFFFARDVLRGKEMGYTLEGASSRERRVVITAQHTRVRSIGVVLCVCVCVEGAIVAAARKRLHQ